MLSVLLVACSTEIKNTESNMTEVQSSELISSEIEENQSTESNTSEPEDTVVDVDTSMKDTSDTETEAGADAESEKVDSEVVESETEAKPKYTYSDTQLELYVKTSVNVRDLPSQDGKKIGNLGVAQKVFVTGTCNETNWYRIDYNGKVGYVHNGYLVREDELYDEYGGYFEPRGNDGGYYCIGGYPVC